MSRIPTLTVLLIFLVLASGCRPQPEEIPASPTPDETVTAPAKSRKDVTICVNRLYPDVLKQKMKADGKQRVSWKGQDAGYEIWFEAATWPFEEAADEEREASGIKYSIIKVPAYSTLNETSNAFTLIEQLPAGTSKEYSYRVGTDPATGLLAPPNSPAIVGEG